MFYRVCMTTSTIHYGPYLSKLSKDTEIDRLILLKLADYFEKDWFRFIDR